MTTNTKPVSASFSSAGGATVKAALVATAVGIASWGSGLVTSPFGVAAIWVAVVVAAIPLRWTRVALSEEGLTVQRGFGVLAGRGQFVHRSQVVRIERHVTDDLHLLLVVTRDGPVRIELADLDVESLLEAIEAEFGEVELRHTLVPPFGPRP